MEVNRGNRKYCLIFPTRLHSGAASRVSVSNHQWPEFNPDFGWSLQHLHMIAWVSSGSSNFLTECKQVGAGRFNGHYNLPRVCRWEVKCGERLVTEKTSGWIGLLWGHIDTVGQMAFFYGKWKYEPGVWSVAPHLKFQDVQIWKLEVDKQIKTSCNEFEMRLTDWTSLMVFVLYPAINTPDYIQVCLCSTGN